MQNAARVQFVEKTGVKKAVSLQLQAARKSLKFIAFEL